MIDIGNKTNKFAVSLLSLLSQFFLSNTIFHDYKLTLCSFFEETENLYLINKFCCLSVVT